MCPICTHTLDGESLGCDQCLEWFHIGCTGLPKAPKNKFWFCRDCRTDQEQQTGKRKSPESPQPQPGPSKRNSISLDQVLEERAIEQEQMPSISTALVPWEIYNDDDDVEEVEKEENELQMKVQHLTEAEIKNMVFGLESDLWKIATGKLYSKRHNTYFNLGQAEEHVILGAAGENGYGIFSDEQENLIMSMLVEMFCSEKVRNFDYTIKVLFPETIEMLLVTATS